MFGLRTLAGTASAARARASRPLSANISAHGPTLNAHLGGAASVRKASTGAMMSGGAAGKRDRRLGMWAKIIAGAAAAVFALDTSINDEWDYYLAKLKPKLSAADRATRPHIVVLGSGWAALNMIRSLEADKFNVTLVSPRNYFLFTPLLCSTASGLLSIRSVIEPVREYLRRSDAETVNFIEADCHAIDHVNKTIQCTNHLGDKTNELEIKYDYLVVATGAQNNTFNIPGVREHAHFMKSATDGPSLKNKLIDSLETAHCLKQKLIAEGKPDEADAVSKGLLRIVLVGGGPTSVELASEVYDFITRDIARNYPHLQRDIQITLVEALPRILSMFDASLIKYTEEKFKRDKIDIWTKSKVVGVTENQVEIELSDSKESVALDYGVLIWCSGIDKTPVVGKLMADIGRANGQTCPRALVVDGHLRVVGAKDIFAIGDAAFYNNLPPTAQVAAQEGKYVARVFNRLSEVMALDFNNITDVAPSVPAQIERLKTFSYLHKGSFAYVGSQQAIADFSKVVPADTNIPTFMQGMAAYILWRSVYFSKLLSYQNRVLVGINWLTSFVYGRDICKHE